jgi:GT2 family glycosyltransferase
MDVSILVVNWNTRELLRQCLQSIYRETRSITFEVIVVDNASSDGSAAMIESEFRQVRLIANLDNRGFAAANNQGIAIAAGRYILLLNSDTVVLEQAIDKSVAFADQFSDTAVTGCRVLNVDRSLQSSCFMFPSLLNFLLHATYLYRLFPRNRFFGREQMSWWDRNDSREVDVVTGCYMLVRRDAIDSVGPMDERFFMYAEETDWCYRFKAEGWKCRFTPDAEIIHVGGGSAPKLGARRAQVTNQSFVKYMFKHWSKPRATVGVYLIALFYIARLLVLLPRKAFTRGKDEEMMFENHLAGLRDILSYKAYRI